MKVERSYHTSLQLIKSSHKMCTRFLIVFFFSFFIAIKSYLMLKGLAELIEIMRHLNMATLNLCWHQITEQCRKGSLYCGNIRADHFEDSLISMFERSSD